MPLTWTPHPASPASDKIGDAVHVRRKDPRILGEERSKRIKIEKDDPYRHGFELDTWKRADEQLKTHSEILVMGGNRAGKSEFGRPSG